MQYLIILDVFIPQILLYVMQITNNHGFFFHRLLSPGYEVYFSLTFIQASGRQGRWFVLENFFTYFLPPSFDLIALASHSALAYPSFLVRFLKPRNPVLLKQFLPTLEDITYEISIKDQNRLLKLH